MSADLIEIPPDIDQIATRIAGNYLDAPISCAKLYREVVAALMAERAAKDTALSNLELVTSGLNKQLTEQFELSTKYIALATAAEAALSEMRAELEDWKRRAESCEQHCVPISVDGKSVFIDGPGDFEIDYEGWHNRAEAAEASLSEMRAELDRLQRRIAEVDGAPSPREGQAIMSEAAAIARAEAAETQLERARKALTAEQALSALQLKMLSEAYLEIDAYRAAARAASQDEGEER